MSRLLLCLMLALSACASGSPSGGYVGGPVAVECAPFARALSGVRLSGAAADWWWQAKERYERSAQPTIGSVLVLRRTSRLPSGHVAVVSQVLGQRHILVTQANWVRHRVSEDQPVVDVSSANDWTLIKVWWPPTGEMGTTTYPAFGFIRPEHPATHDQLTAATPRAIRLAVNE